MEVVVGGLGPLESLPHARFLIGAPPTVYVSGVAFVEICPSYDVRNLHVVLTYLYVPINFSTTIPCVPSIRD